MNIDELKSFRLSDAVKFHDQLNPKLFENGELDPEVREQLLLIAEDFITELGIKALDVDDVTISGSNAAYTYTKHSDLDLHILVDMSKLSHDDIYRELFTAKKTIYNDSHDITIRGIPVELYVQDSKQPVKSLGEYSIVHNKWLRFPSKRRANFDQNATQAKYEKLGNMLELAFRAKNYKKLIKVLDILKRYRKAGLEKGGEFGPENLAFKALRKQGIVKALYDLKDALHSRELSIEDYDPNGPPPGPEFKPTMPKGTIKVDVSDVYDWYKLGQHISNLKGLGHHDFGQGPPSTILSFGDEDTEHKYIHDLEKTGLTTTDIDPAYHDKVTGQKVDPRYNVGEAARTFQSVASPIEKLIQAYGYFATLGIVHLDKQGKTPEAQKQLLSLVQRLNQDGKIFANLDKNKIENNHEKIISHIHEMMTYAIPVLKKYLPADVWEAKRNQINSVLQAYNDANTINEASGYIPSNAEKNDPRFKTALTVDIKPDTMKNNAKKLGWKISRAGLPPLLRK